MPPAGATTTLTRTRFRRPVLEDNVCNAKAGCLYAPNSMSMGGAEYGIQYNQMGMGGMVQAGGASGGYPPQMGGGAGAARVESQYYPQAQYYPQYSQQSQYAPQPQYG